MYQTILVPTDGSEGADAAVEHALNIASIHDATLHTIYAVDPSSIPAEVGAATVIDALEETGKAAIDHVVDRAEAAGLTVEHDLLRGSPHRVILGYATDHDIDLIVMGTHGRTGIDRFLLGSVTERVVRTSEVPVLTVRMPST